MSRNTSIDTKSIILRNGQPDTYRRSSNRAQFFKAYPSAILVARRMHSGGVSAFRVKCFEDGCRNTIALYHFKTRKSKKCSAHSFPTFQGVPLRSAHLVEMADRLVSVEKTRRRGRKKSYRYTFKIACSVDGCRGLVDVTTEASARRRKVCQKCSYTTIPRMFVDKKSRLSAFTPAQKLSIHKKIVGYFITRSSRNTWLKKPAIRCHAKGCMEIVKFNKSRYTQEGGFLYCAGHGRARRRLRPYESLFRMTEKNALKRDLDFDLTLAQFSRLVAQGRCFYCCVSLRTEPFFNRNHSARQRTNLDRVDDSKGYTLDNLVLACAPCNLTRFRWMLPEEMQILGQLRSGNTKKAKSLCGQYSQIVRSHGDRLQEHVFNKKRVTQK